MPLCSTLLRRSAFSLQSRALSSVTPSLRPTAFKSVSAASTRQVPTLARFLNTSQPVSLEASAIVGDGGNEEAPHHGINVDRKTSMDA